MFKGSVAPTPKYEKYRHLFQSKSSTEYNELFECGYESELFARNQGCIHSADSVEKRFLNGSKQKKTGINIPEFVQ